MQKSLAFQLLNVLADVLFFGLFLLLPAGAPGVWPSFLPSWWQAWVLLGVMLVLRLLGTFQVHRLNAELLAERVKSPLQKGQPLSDKILLSASMASHAFLVAFTGWDHGHQLLGSPLPLALCFVGLGMFAAGQLIITTVFKTNAYAATVVRHQQERAHRVVEQGLYGRVRHPMYAGLILINLGIPLWLGSRAGLLVALLPVFVLMVRIVAEERFLSQELPGYADYRSRVKWRLLPGVW